MCGVFSFFFFLFPGAYAAAEELKDVKPPVDFPTNYWPLILIFVALAIGTVVFFIHYFLKRLKQKRLSAIVKTPGETAFERLDALKKENFPAQGKFKEFYTELSDIIRRYIEERFHIRAPEMTTEEFLWSLKNSAELTDDHKSFLKDFLISCDLVKFAKYGPGLKEAEDSFNFARRLIEETKEVPNESGQGI